MTKRFIAATIAAVALLAGALVPQQATAAPAVSTAAAAATDAAGQCYTGNTFPTDVNGCRFWSASNTLSPIGVCVDGSGINGDYYRVAYIAQRWNTAVDLSVFALNYEDDCVAANYPPSRRFVVGTFNNPAEPNCLKLTNLGGTVYNGMYRWSDGPGVYINIAHSGCVGSQTYRDHEVSTAIGYIMGLSTLASSGWASRVMCSCSRGTVAFPDAASAQKLREVYSGYYGG